MKTLVGLTVATLLSLGASAARAELCELSGDEKKLCAADPTLAVCPAPANADDASAWLESRRAVLRAREATLATAQAALTSAADTAASGGEGNTRVVDRGRVRDEALKAVEAARLSTRVAERHASKLRFDVEEAKRWQLRFSGELLGGLAAGDHSQKGASISFGFRPSLRTEGEIGWVIRAFDLSDSRRGAGAPHVGDVTFNGPRVRMIFGKQLQAVLGASASRGRRPGATGTYLFAPEFGVGYRFSTELACHDATPILGVGLSIEPVVSTEHPALTQVMFNLKVELGIGFLRAVSLKALDEGGKEVAKANFGCKGDQG